MNDKLRNVAPSGTGIWRSEAPLSEQLNQHNTAITACDARAPDKFVSQVDEVLEEHAKALIQLSEELIRSRQCFRAVLLPDGAEGCNSPGEPEPMRSPLAQAIVGQTQLVRSMLLDLRSLNNRSTV